MKKSGKKRLELGKFRVTVFGSSRIQEGDQEYQDIYKLAKMIGNRGIDIISGGGPGIMKAASAGHKAGSKRSGAKTIGLGIRLPHEQRANRYLDIEKKFNRFSARLDNFMALSNVIVVAPGGVGTTLELFYAWQLMQVKHVCNIPIILFGDQWKGIIKWLEKEPLKRGFLDRKDLNLLFLANNCGEAIKMIEKAYWEYNKGTKDFCLNFKKYKLY